MLRIILSGCNGAVGKVITHCVADREDCKLVAGIDIYPGAEAGFRVYSSPLDCKVGADVIIDFSHPDMLDSLLDIAINRRLPIVVATTGLSTQQLERLSAASKKTPVFHTANMSLGINLMLELSKLAARVLGNDFDIEIVEKHHNQKIDAPSGTALMLADGISSELDTPSQYVYDRHSQRKKRQKNEIGIHAIRGGTIVGEHDIIFAGRDEVLTISHCATSKEVFAVGAINAALFLAGKPNGLYSMADLMV